MHWHQVQPLGDRRAGQSAAAAAIQIDEVMSGSSYYSQNDFRLHFGLGGAARPKASRSHGPPA